MYFWAGWSSDICITNRAGSRTASLPHGLPAARTQSPEPPPASRQHRAQHTAPRGSGIAARAQIFPLLFSWLQTSSRVLEDKPTRLLLSSERDSLLFSVRHSDSAWLLTVHRADLMSPFIFLLFLPYWSWRITGRRPSLEISGSPEPICINSPKLPLPSSPEALPHHYTLLLPPSLRLLQTGRGDENWYFCEKWYFWIQFFPTANRKRTSRSRALLQKNPNKTNQATQAHRRI